MPRVTFTLTVDYTPNGCALEHLADLAEQNIRNMIGDGGLTSETEAEVETWELTYVTEK